MDYAEVLGVNFGIISDSIECLERHVSIGDALDIVCPFYNQDVDFMDSEQSIIYRVPKSDYDSCTLSQAARELGRCISPMKRDKVKVSFRLLSPNPSALDYRPGHTYYFICELYIPLIRPSTEEKYCTVHILSHFHWDSVGIGQH
ncbi:Ephrin [Ancylostoma duodenale]|uniref:Ephrin n=1 Tax=Ancylostoma duodenale TaxID=51022 RepID=A0A0C2C9A6_9BILA|nr:Ephrin [Ancylostoma duodenale]